MTITMKNLLSHSKTFLGLRKKITASVREHDYEFAALFLIKNINVQLDNDLEETLQILNTLENLTKKSRVILETNCSVKERILWENILDALQDNLNQISQQLNYLNTSISSKSKVHSSLFWQHNQCIINRIKTDYENLGKIAFQILPQVEKMYWRSAIAQVQEEMLTAVLSRISICKQQYDFTTQYTPHKKTSTIMQNMLRNIPINFTLDEAQKYVSDNMKIETKPKNINWASFFNFPLKSSQKSSSENMIANQ